MYVIQQKGISLVEVVIGVAIAGLVIVFVSHTITLFLATSEETLNRTKALYLAEEGQEILRYIRDMDWDEIDALTVPAGTTYYLEVTDTTLSTTTTAEVIDSTYTREFVLSSVERDGNDDITTSGTPDDGSLFVTFTVDWGISSTSLTTLLTNIHNI